MRKNIGAILILSFSFITFFILQQFNLVGQESNASPKLKANLTTHSINPQDSNMETNIKVVENKLEINLRFIDGAGNNDKASLKLMDKKKTLQIVLMDTDHVRQKMLIGYSLTGTISNIQPGKYNLEIITSDNKKIVDKEFEVK